jgi:hypothetical protein
MAALGLNMVEYSTVTRCLREAKGPLSTEEASAANDRKPVDDADEAILSVLKESICACAAALATHSPLSKDRLSSPDLISSVHHVSSSLGAPCSVRRAKNSASDTVSVTVVNAGSVAGASLA